ANGTRLLEVSEGSSLTLTRLKLSGGTAVKGGGAVYSQSANLTLDNCTFQGNVVTEGNGGAVWADGEGEHVTIVGGEFLATGRLITAAPCTLSRAAWWLKEDPGSRATKPSLAVGCSTEAELLRFCLPWSI
ncbi:unnamed protein product, partial [Laminaria digitata]